VAGRPYHSSLVPYEDEILELRNRKPPTPYRQIAELLFQRYQLKICRETIFKFIRARSRARKMFCYKRRPTLKELKSGHKPSQRAVTHAASKTKFEFEYSERYNLKRLPPEEAAAIRKKLEAEGH
jgi:hypothetical protein